MISRIQEEIMQKWPVEYSEPFVSIRCLAYNHEHYIAQTLDGFLSQITSFPFKIVIHDDASTDNTANIIRMYEKKYPKLIKAIYESENQYSKRDGSLSRIVNSACNGKYWALCEGDDYWIDPNKLQMQVDWLESHPDYTMCCSDAVIESPDGILDWHRYEKKCDITVKDMILGGGAFVQTATLVYRRSILNNYPEACKKCHVGDYPLQLWAILNGKVHYFPVKTAVYRFLHTGSWSTNQRKLTINTLIENWQSEFDMLDSLDSYSNKKYSIYFREEKESFFHNSLLKNKEKWFYILSKIKNFRKSYIAQRKIEGFFILLHLDSIANAYYFATKKEYKIAILSLPIIKKLYPFYYYRILRHKRTPS